MTPSLKPRLLIGIGNPSRGDDALGPSLVERLEALALPELELLTDYQLQVEYLLDLHGRAEIVIADASLVGTEPYSVAPLLPAPDHAYSSHAISPAALLAAYQTHYGEPPPPCRLLAIRGYAFELGEGLSDGAAANLEAALDWLREIWPAAPLPAGR